MENFFALLAICVGNSAIPGKFPAQKPVAWSFDVSFIWVWINGWANNSEAGDLRRYRAHYDVTLMNSFWPVNTTPLLKPMVTHHQWNYNTENISNRISSCCLLWYFIYDKWVLFNTDIFCYHSNNFSTKGIYSILRGFHAALKNSLWHSNTIWQHRSGSTLALIMASYLMASSHYLNQCWLIIIKALWHSPKGVIIKGSEDTSLWTRLITQAGKLKFFWYSPILGSLLYSLYKIRLAQACFPLARPNFYSHWRVGER